MTETFNGSHIVFRKLIVDHSRRPRKPTRLDETSSVWKLVFNLLRLGWRSSQVFAIEQPLKNKTCYIILAFI